MVPRTALEKDRSTSTVVFPWHTVSAVFTATRADLDVALADELWPQRADDFDNPLASLRGILPDVYGKQDHAAALKRLAYEKAKRDRIQFRQMSSALDDLMSGMCGPSRTDPAPAVEEPKKR
ncbi:MAG TPA: hypothetical protein VJ019_10450 [Aestuariivirga sp.]|nr:hypothetical protein [Aestuariivirga sp.]